MRSMTCPLCGCGELIESDIAGYECENCGESFNTDDSGELTIMDFDVWLDCYFRYERDQRQGREEKKKKNKNVFQKDIFCLCGLISLYYQVHQMYRSSSYRTTEI